MRRNCISSLRARSRPGTNSAEETRPCWRLIILPKPILMKTKLSGTCTWFLAASFAAPRALSATRAAHITVSPLELDRENHVARGVGRNNALDRGDVQMAK